MKPRKRLTLVRPVKEPALPKRLNAPALDRGWRPERALDQIPQMPQDNWLRYQAMSILGRSVSIEEARDLFSRIDINTRQPIPETDRSTGRHRLLNWLRSWL